MKPSAAFYVLAEPRTIGGIMKRGRKRIYHTLEQRMEASRRAAMKAYWRKRARQFRHQGNEIEALRAEEKMRSYIALTSEELFQLQGQ